MSGGAAMKRIKLILDTPPYLIDDRSFVILNNEPHEQAQSFIRDNLDLKGMGITSDWGYDELPTDFAQRILDDLAIIWADGFYRDEISEIAMSLSLCPLHFCDWAACFDDEDTECEQIRAIFPHGHDT